MRPREIDRRVFEEYVDTMESVLDRTGLAFALDVLAEAVSRFKEQPEVAAKLRQFAIDHVHVDDWDGGTGSRLLSIPRHEADMVAIERELNRRRAS